jgi:hypothetical protein
MNANNQATIEAIEILINNFTRNPRLNPAQQPFNHETMNVFDMLQEFWQLKQNGNLNIIPSPNDSNLFINSLSNHSLNQQSNNANIQIVYEFFEKPDPPYVCFVTLPNGSCFATFQVFKK